MRYTDAEGLVKAWAIAGPIGAVLTRLDAGVSIYLAMPEARPLPCLIISRVGGAPPGQADLPKDMVRISLHVWAPTRSAGVGIARLVATECVDLADRGGYSSIDGHLQSAEVLTWVWSPDPTSDIPRYIIDALFVVLPAT